jgi:hypothetical protein
MSISPGGSGEAPVPRSQYELLEQRLLAALSDNDALLKVKASRVHVLSFG